MSAKKGLRTVAVCCVALIASAFVPAGVENSDPVIDAARQGKAEALLSLVSQGVDVNGQEGDGMSALHWAATRGDVEVVRVLLSAGARTDLVTRNGNHTALHLAARAGHAEAAAALLGAGADPIAQSATGATPLHLAASAGNVESLRALIDHGAEPDVRESAWGQTPLMFAASSNRAAAIRLLLESGADPSAQTRVVSIPELEAEDRMLRQERDRRMASIWGEAPPDAGYRNEPGSSEEKAPKDEEPEGVQTQAERDAQRERLSFAQLVGNRGGLTALHHAVRRGHKEAATALLEGGAVVDQVSGDHSSALLVATINGHFDLALELVRKHGADPTLASEAGATPLYTTINLRWAPATFYPQPSAHRQQETSYLELMEALLQAGADPNVRLDKELWYTGFGSLRLNVTRWGATPFWRAAYGADVEAMRLLVAYGADPMIPTKRLPGSSGPYGFPPALDDYPFPEVPTGGPATYAIHAASGAGYGLGYDAGDHRHAPDGWMPSVRYLVEELGVDVNLRDFQGYTPLHNAASRGDNELILYLIEKGADVTAVSRFGQTTVDMANGPIQRINPFPRTIELLESLGAKNNHNCVSC